MFWFGGVGAGGVCIYAEFGGGCPMLIAGLGVGRKNFVWSVVAVGWCVVFCWAGISCSVGMYAWYL